MKFERRKLKNGMSVILEKRDLPVVAFGIANRFGAAYENSKIKGVAHVIEHLLFTGTKTRTSKEISAEIEKKGGILNAFTSHEMTCFWFKLPSEHVFAGLEILTDMLNNPLFEKEKFEKEKRVILEEIKMCHDDPSNDIFNKVEQCLYDKPFGELIIGSAETVSGLKRDEVAKIFEENYNPKNYTVCIVGNVDLDKVCEFLEKKFKGNKAIPRELAIKKINKDIKEERAGIDQAHFAMAFHAPLASEKEFMHLKVLDSYLAFGMSSPLFMEIREKRGWAYVVKSSVESEKNYAYYVIYAGTLKDKVEEVKKLVIEELKKVDKITEAQVKEAKETLKGLRKISREESSNVLNKLVFEEFATKAEDYYDFEKQVEEVKISDVKKMAKKLLEKYSVAMIVPK
jgi:predicted Zn-dependent peptidase